MHVAFSPAMIVVDHEKNADVVVLTMRQKGLPQSASISKGLSYRDEGRT